MSRSEFDSQHRPLNTEKTVESMSLMELDTFVTEEEPQCGKLQYWINGDEHCVILEQEKSSHEPAPECNVRVITSEVKIMDDMEGRTDAQVWGVPFTEIAAFVDAIRAIKKNEQPE